MGAVVYHQRGCIWGERFNTEEGDCGVWGVQGKGGIYHRVGGIEFVHSIALAMFNTRESCDDAQDI